MLKRYWPVTRSIAASLFMAALPLPAQAFLFGQASEWTQLLNNAELVHLSGQSAQQIQNQVSQIGQMAEQIQNQLRIYENMLQNTALLPDHVWGQVAADLRRLEQLIAQGEGIAFSMGDIENALKQRFGSFSDFTTGLANGESFSDSYQIWSDTNRETIAATLRAAGLTSEQFGSEEATMAQLRNMSEGAIGQMQALQIGHDIAAQQVAQAQKLRGLVSQQVTMMATWYQSEQATKDLAQARREEFFNSVSLPTSGGQTMEPRW
jgi:type IV secretion system protein TrbJ